MAKLSILAGATSQSVNVWVQDSSSTTGAGLGGIAPAGGSLLTGTKLYYSFTGANGSAGVAVSLAVLAAVNSAWSSAGIVQLDNTNLIGFVRIDLPNAALATSKGRVVSFLLFGGTNMAPCAFEIELTGVDNQDGVRYGLTALPNAAANAAGGLPVSTAGGLDLDEMNVDIEAIQTSTAGLTFTGAGKVDASVRDWVGVAPNALTQGKLDTQNVMRTNTATAGAAGTITLDGSAVATDSYYYGALITIIAGTGANQGPRFISSYVGATKVASVRPNFTVTPDNTSVFCISPWGAVDVEQWGSSAIASPATAGIPEVNVKNINNVSAAAVTTVKAVQGLTTADQVTTAVNLTTNNDKTGYALGTGGVDATSIASQTTSIWGQAVTDLAAVPSATDTILKALTWLFMLGRNKVTQTATTQLVLKDDSTTTAGTSTVSDDATTFVRGKFS